MPHARSPRFRDRPASSCARGLLAAVVVVPVVLAGCAGAGIYGKPDVTYQEWKRDDDECRRAAGAAGRGTDAEAYTRCMRDRGYRIQ